MRVAILLAAMAFAGCASGAPGAKSPARETARGAVLTLAEAVHVADGACAAVARERQDSRIAKACGDAYDVARPALLSAESAIDAWDAVSQKKAICAAADAARALHKVADTVVAAGGSVPDVIVDALKLTVSFEGGCRG